MLFLVYFCFVGEDKHQTSTIVDKISLLRKGGFRKGSDFSQLGTSQTHYFLAGYDFKTCPSSLFKPLLQSEANFLLTFAYHLTKDFSLRGNVRAGREASDFGFSVAGKLAGIFFSN